MARATIALFALLILTLSAGFGGAVRGQATPAQAQYAAVLPSEVHVHLLEQGPAAPAPGPDDDRPAPALLAYLGLVIAGSAAAIVAVRFGERRAGA